MRHPPILTDRLVSNNSTLCPCLPTRTNFPIFSSLCKTLRWRRPALSVCDDTRARSAKPLFLASGYNPLNPKHPSALAWSLLYVLPRSLWGHQLPENRSRWDRFSDRGTLKRCR